jgi:hypothetical protein
MAESLSGNLESFFIMLILGKRHENRNPLYDVSSI